MQKLVFHKSMIFGHALIAATTALLIYDWIKFKKQRKLTKNGFKTVKICLTGGPCGGKSSGIECLYSTFKSISAPFFIVPQAATLIGSSGLTLDFSNFNGQQIQRFQIYLMRLQYNLQEIYNNVAQAFEKLGLCPVLLCDRGLMDGKAYAGDQNWARMLKKLNITEQQLNSRYIAVIHMQTAAKGAQNNYFYVPNQSQKQENGKEKKGNAVRKEPPEVAIQLDEKVQACYKNHPFRFIIRNYFFVLNFEMKKLLLIAQVNQLLQFILKIGNVQNHYQKGLQFKFDKEFKERVPYIERKRKYQKFLTNRAKSLNK